MKVNPALCKILSRYYCPHHGFCHPVKGMCQEDVEEQIQRDGHDVNVFREKLANRTAKVDPNEWHCESLPPYRTLPLDFDPVYRKYLEMLKECHECEMKATQMAMAGIGLVYCVKRCHKYVDVNFATFCQDCKDAHCCRDCGYLNDCEKCCSSRSKEYFCSKCRFVVYCSECFRSICMKHNELYKFMKMCFICDLRLCESCLDDFDRCRQCDVYICRDHEKSYVCEKCKDVVCCWECKDSYNCGHNGLHWKRSS